MKKLINTVVKSEGKRIRGEGRRTVFRRELLEELRDRRGSRQGKEGMIRGRL
jgi:hypothetical protein